jgi:hypothetical protein
MYGSDVVSFLTSTVFDYVFTVSSEAANAKLICPTNRLAVVAILKATFTNGRIIALSRHTNIGSIAFQPQN